MNTPASRQGLLTVVAACCLLAAAALYFNATRSSGLGNAVSHSKVATPAPLRAGRTDDPAGDDSGRNPQWLSHTARKMATRPVVKPKEHTEAVRAQLSGALPAISLCYVNAIGGSPPDKATAWIRFKVTAEGRPGPVDVAIEGLEGKATMDCLADAVAGLDLNELPENATVFWPIDLALRSGPRLR